MTSEQGRRPRKYNQEIRSVSDAKIAQEIYEKLNLHKRSHFLTIAWVEQPADQEPIIDYYLYYVTGIR